MPADNSFQVPRRFCLSLDRGICQALIGWLVVCHSFDSAAVSADGFVASSRIGQEPKPPLSAPTKAQIAERALLPDGMALEIVAAAPLVTHPIHMEFDHHGRLWVVEWISDDGAPRKDRKIGNFRQGLPPSATPTTTVEWTPGSSTRIG